MHPSVKYLGAAAALGIVGILAFNTILQGREPIVQSCTAEAKICPDGTAVGRTGPNCEFAACPNGDAMFSREGQLVFNDNIPSVGSGTFVYRADDGSNASRNLAFDTESMCVSGTGMISCIAMSASLDVAFGQGKDVKVIGIDRGADLLVRRLELITRGSEQATRETFVTRIGQEAGALDVSVTPLEVVDDSRCPPEVQCVWAGTVRVRATLESGLGTSPVTFEIGQSITTEAEFVTLTSVTPTPTAGESINPADYRFTFEVSKR